MQSAYLPETKDSPHRSRMVLLGGLIGVILSSLLILLADFFNLKISYLLILMNYLVLGSGGREYAICMAIKRTCNYAFCIGNNANPGIIDICDGFEIFKLIVLGIVIPSR